MTRLDESGIIKLFQKRFSNKKFRSEDAETFRIGKKLVVVKIDTLVESTDIPKQMSLKEAAKKSIVGCVSDFAAKGVKPLYGIISINVPRNFSEKMIKEIASGINQESRNYGFEILGGDTNEGKELVISVVILGVAKKIIPRNGAKVGDIIFTTGPFGYTAAGLEIMLNRRHSNSKLKKKAFDSIKKPKSRLEFCLEAKNYFTSAMDSSDGLSTTLNELARQSKVRFKILSIPTKNEIFDFAKRNRISPRKLIFDGGEEYEIVFTISKGKMDKLIHLAKRMKIPLIEIGIVEKGRGVVCDGMKVNDLGWKHLRQSR